MPQPDGSLLFDSKFDLAGFQVGVDLISDAVSGIGEKLKNLAVSVVTTGMDFTASMSEVQALSGATGAELDALTETAKKYGASTKYTAAESAQALKYMALAGWDSQQMMDGLPGVLNLAAASGEDLATTSDIVTDALTAFGMSAEDSTRFVDVLAQASSNSNTTVGMMGETFKYVAPVAGALGYSIEDTAVAIGLMANSGIKAGQAGTALRAVMSRMADPPEDTAKAMDALGLSLTDSEGNMKSLDEVMQDMRDAFSGLDASEKAAYASTIGGTEAMSGLLAIVNASEGDFNKLTESINNSTGACEEMASTMQDNVTGDLANLSSAFEGLKLNVFEEMKEPIRDVLQTLTKTLQDSKTQKAASDLGKVLADMAKTLANKLPDAIEAVSKIVKLLWENKGLIAGIGAAVAAGKAISSVTTGVKLFATDISSVVKAVKSLGDTKKTLSGLDSVLKGIGGLGTFTAVIGGLAAIKKVHEETTRQMYDDIYEVSDAVKKATENATQNIEAFHESMQQNHTEVLDADAELENIQALKQRLEELVNDNGTIKDGYADEVTGILDQINAYAGTSYEVLDGIITKNGDVITNFQEASTELDNLIEKQHAQAVLGAFEDDYTQAIQERTEKTEALAQARRDYNDAVLDYNMKKAENDQANAMHMNAPWSEVEMKEAAANVEEHAESIRTLTQDLKNCTTTISNYEAALKAIQNGDYTGLETLRQMAETPIQTVETAASLDELKTQYRDYLSIYEEMQRMQAEGFDIDESTMLATKEKVAASLIELGKASGLEGGLVTGEQFMQALQDSALSETEKIEAIKNFVGENLDMGTSLFNTAFESAKNYFEGLAEGLELNKDLVIASATGVGNAVSEAVNNSLVIRSPSRVGMKSGMYYDEGFALGIEKGIPDVSAISSDMANAAVSSTLGIMDVQGASAVAPYSSVYAQAYHTPSQVNTQTTAVATATPSIFVYPTFILEGEQFAPVVLDVITRENANSGGWSV